MALDGRQSTRTHTTTIKKQVTIRRMVGTDGATIREVKIHRFGGSRVGSKLIKNKIIIIISSSSPPRLLCTTSAAMLASPAAK